MREPTRWYEARVLSGLTLGQAARLTGIPRRDLGELEWYDTDRLDPSSTATPGEFRRAAEVYGVRVEWLCGEVSTPAEIAARSGIALGQLGTLTESDRTKLLRSLDATCDQN